jgi:hypothetical protein
MKKIGIYDIILEGYAKQVVIDINSKSHILNRFGHFMEGIRLELSSLRYSLVVHVWREANLAAHCLARAAVTHVTYTIRLEEIPSIIFDIVYRESIVPLC